jgi:hypothetical protein
VAVRRPSPLPRVQSDNPRSRSSYSDVYREAILRHQFICAEPRPAPTWFAFTWPTPPRGLSASRERWLTRAPHRAQYEQRPVVIQDPHISVKGTAFSPPVDLPPVSTPCDGCHHSASGPSQIRYAGAVRSLPFFGCILTTLF